MKRGHTTKMTPVMQNYRSSEPMLHTVQYNKKVCCIQWLAFLQVHMGCTWLGRHYMHIKVLCH